VESFLHNDSNKSSFLQKDKENIKSTNPIAPWIGGKSQLASTIVPLIDYTPHVTYAEPFVGMGGIFLRRNRRPKSEVINDINQDIINLFRILQCHFVQFMDVLKWQITSRAEFERLIKLTPESLTDLQRAARFLYLQRLAFGGKVSGQNFGVSAQTPGRFDITKLHSQLEDVHERLSGVVLECLSWADFIPKYDHKDCLFYLDPPYYDCEDDYGKNIFSKDDFEKIASLLKGIKGQFILSLNDHPDVRTIFKDFEIESVNVTYSIGGGDKTGKFGEVIIKNFNPPSMLF
jgi:DNA adenine methylase